MGQLQNQRRAVRQFVHPFCQRLERVQCAVVQPELGRAGPPFLHYRRRLKPDQSRATLGKAFTAAHRPFSRRAVFVAVKALHWMDRQTVFELHVGGADLLLRAEYR